MLKVWRFSLVLVLATSTLLGCTTMRAVDSTQLTAALGALEAGDRVSVLTARGWQDNLYVVAVTDTALDLKTIGDEPVTVNRADLWELQLPAPSPGKRAAVISVSVGLGVLALFYAAGYELDY